MAELRKERNSLRASVDELAHTRHVLLVERDSLRAKLDTEESQYDDLRSRVGTLFVAIAHGDESHRRWLEKTIQDHFLDHYKREAPAEIQGL